MTNAEYPKDLDCEILFKAPVAIRRSVSEVIACFEELGLRPSAEARRFGEVALGADGLEGVKECSGGPASIQSTSTLLFDKGASPLIYKCTLGEMSEALCGSLLIEAPGLWYPSASLPEPQYEQLRRLQAVTTMIVERLGASWAESPSRSWTDYGVEKLFRIESGSLTRFQDVELETSSEWELERLFDWIEESGPDWISVSGRSILLDGSSFGRPRALVRNHLWSGHTLEPAKKESRFAPPAESSEGKKLEAASRRANSLEHVIAEFGPPNCRLDQAGANDGYLEERVGALAFYWDLLESAVVIIRSYTSHRVGINFAGKERAVSRS